jgi:hypothetical protein
MGGDGDETLSPAGHFDYRGALPMHHLRGELLRGAEPDGDEVFASARRVGHGGDAVVCIAGACVGASVLHVDANAAHVDVRRCELDELANLVAWITGRVLDQHEATPHLFDPAV